MDDTKSRCQLIKMMTKFMKETSARHRLYVFIRQKLPLSRRHARQQRVHMTRSVHLHRHDVLTVPLTVQLQA